MENIGIKVHLLRQELNQALKIIEKPQELLAQLQEEGLLQPGETTKIGELALEAEDKLEAFVKGFEEFAEWLEKAVEEREAAVTQDVSGAQTYTPPQAKRGNGHAF